jgi:hypothetical protein
MLGSISRQTIILVYFFDKGSRIDDKTRILFTSHCTVRSTYVGLLRMIATVIPVELQYGGCAGKEYGAGPLSVYRTPVHIMLIA